MLPLGARVDLGAMAIKEYSAFPKASTLLGPVYSSPPADLGRKIVIIVTVIRFIIETRCIDMLKIISVSKF